MKKLLIASSFIALCGSAWADVTPTPGKEDPRICEVNYDADNVLSATIRVGDNVVIRPGPGKIIVDTAPSDTAHLQEVLSNDHSQVFIKASMVMQSQPYFFRAADASDPTKPRDYMLQLNTIDPLLDKAKNVQEASLKSDDMQEIPVKPKICYMIRYNYPNEVSAQAVAAWKARQARIKAQEAEVALHNVQDSKSHNPRYMAQGDTSIMPTDIWDDGDTTWMTFPGNRVIPVIQGKQPDNKKDDVTLGQHVMQNGVVRIDGTAKIFRLEYGDLVACIYNLAYNAIGTNPGTGTTSSTIERTVGAH